MTLTLSILRAPATVDLQPRHVHAGGFAIGRAADNDWALPDPERHLSKRHCLLSLRDGDWQLADLSTNGTFLNREAEPVGGGRPRDLRDGDRLRLGGYEIAVHIAATAPPPPPTPFAGGPLPDGLDLPGFAEAAPFDGPVQSDHAPGIEDAFRPPRPVALLDDDWDLGEFGATPAVPLPPPVPVTAVPDGGDLLAAFLRGAGMQARPADPQAAMEALGSAFRATVSGLRAALIARAAIKGEFRIAPTMIRASGNNPLKFSAGDDDALAALLGAGRQTGMAPATAIAEALRDMKLHELATIAAMQGAARALLAELEPARLREAAGTGGVLPAQRKARAWDAFEALHARLTQATSHDFDGIFGHAFAQAYERALHDAGARESEP
jgi:type VI secretion system protein ImpI/type VI secretion system protein